MADIVHLDGIWTKFLELWPVEKVRAMTLEQYHTLNDPTCFQRCLESMTEKLGSIWGGSAFKFGIYQRASTEDKKSSGYIYGVKYAWQARLGDSPAIAFAAVKKHILSIINAVQHRNLNAVEDSVLWQMVAWKIAFLYQDRNDPQVLSVYTQDKLVAALDDVDREKLSMAELNRRLMARRNGKNLHEYSEEVWNMTPQPPVDGKGETTGTPQPAASGASIPLNQILYGPPGTGKTYATVEKALEIFAAAGMRDVGATREKKRQRFDELVADGHIRFVTFHQSFSYEDFVEGIRASTDEGKITYQVEDGIFKELCREAHEAAKTGKTTPYVLIIDEINRGNISRIFGELITLVEASHRACLPNSPHTRDSITVRLPYSRDLFSVPENVYIIGTMNTADRSLTGLDAALRRRFSFTEMPPRPELLEGSRLQGTEFSLADLLDRINRRITVLLDKEHRLGHAWFMGLGTVVTAEALAIVFRNHILPLLEEYFFEDWEKIQWVLNDYRKEAETSFLLRDDTDLSSLFGDDVQLPDRGQGWHWNPEAFGNMASYAQIIDAEVWPEPDDEADTGNCGADEETAIESFTDLGEQIDSVEWREYRIERYRTRAGSNPIRVFQNGKYVGDRLVSQTLRVIAAYLDIELKGANTQSQGNFLIQKLKELGQKA